MSNEPRPRYRIRNIKTGTYAHFTLFKIAEFYSKADALKYIKRNGLNQSIYSVEVVWK